MKLSVLEHCAQIQLDKMHKPVRRIEVTAEGSVPSQKSEASTSMATRPFPFPSPLLSLSHCWRRPSGRASQWRHERRRPAGAVQIGNKQSIAKGMQMILGTKQAERSKRGSPFTGVMMRSTPQSAGEGVIRVADAPRGPAFVKRSL